MRKVVIGLGLLAATAFGMAPSDWSVGPAPAPVWNAPQNSVFYDHPLLLKQYGFGVLGSVVAGALGFYVGNALEGAFYDSHSHKGYLSFTGIRYENQRGPFWGGGSGILLGSAVTAFFMGDADEEQGSLFWTLVGGGITTAAAFGLADAMGVQETRKWSPFLPLLVVPTTGAVIGYHVSRWFNDKKRYKATETGAALLLPPRLAFAPTSTGVAWRLDALNLSF